MAILPSVLAQYAERVEKAGFGEKEKIIEEGCNKTGLSRATFLRQIKPYRPASGRKVRSDKGKHQMDKAELEVISATWLQLRRKNGKTMATLERVLDILRANHKVKAEFLDSQTGGNSPLFRHQCGACITQRQYASRPVITPYTCGAVAKPSPEPRLANRPVFMCAVLLKGNRQRQWAVYYGTRTVL